MARLPNKRQLKVVDASKVTSAQEAMNIMAFAKGPVLFTNVQMPDNGLYLTRSSDGAPKTPEDN